MLLGVISSVAVLSAIGFFLPSLAQTYNQTSMTGGNTTNATAGTNMTGTNMTGTNMTGTNVTDGKISQRG